ncbi:acetylornithine deacetylase ArgE [Bradyrhizobium sp. LB1.3]
MPSSRPDRIRKLLADLVGFDTISDRSNLPLIAHIESYLAALGVKGERIVDETGQKASLWVTIGPEDRPGLVLSGHTDVVPVVGQDWSHDPFKLIERDGRLYGRGTTDMKGFVAVCLAMVPEMLEVKLATPIHLAISYDEEIGCVGVRPMLGEIAKKKVRPLGCFVGEPTEMKVIIGHKGKHGVRATFRGLARHSSIAPDGVNAIEFAAELIVEIRRRTVTLAAVRSTDSLYDVPHSTLLTSIVHGGAALNIVPDSCTVDFECRGIGITESREVTDAIVAWAKAELEPAMKSMHPECGIDFEEILDYPALDTAADAAIVTLAKSLAGRNDHAKGRLRHRGEPVRQHGRYPIRGDRPRRNRAGAHAGRIRGNGAAGEMRGVRGEADRALCCVIIGVCSYLGPGSAEQHFVLHRVRDKKAWLFIGLRRRNRSPGIRSHVPDAVRHAVTRRRAGTQAPLATVPQHAILSRATIGHRLHADALFRVHPREQAKRDSLCRGHQQSRSTNDRAQVQTPTRLHAAIRCNSARLLRNLRVRARGTLTRAFVEALATGVEAQADRRAQSGLARSYE